jgi:uncharacterized membrane protein YeaQ/YmgE (transglycosylase-associated protein family)
MVNILSWIITGLIVGALARVLLPGRQPIGLIRTILLGVAGAFAGGLIGSLFNGTVNHVTMTGADWRWQEWAVAVLGAVLILWGYVALTTPRDTAEVRRTT